MILQTPYFDLRVSMTQLLTGYWSRAAGLLHVVSPTLRSIWCLPPTFVGSAWIFTTLRAREMLTILATISYGNPHGEQRRTSEGDWKVSLNPDHGRSCRSGCISQSLFSYCSYNTARNKPRLSPGHRGGRFTSRTFVACYAHRPISYLIGSRVSMRCHQAAGYDYLYQ